MDFPRCYCSAAAGWWSKDLLKPRSVLLQAFSRWSNGTVMVNMAHQPQRWDRCLVCSWSAVLPCMDQQPLCFSWTLWLSALKTIIFWGSESLCFCACTLLLFSPLGGGMPLKWRWWRWTFIVEAKKAYAGQRGARTKRSLFLKGTRHSDDATSLSNERSHLIQAKCKTA